MSGKMLLAPSAAQAIAWWVWLLLVIVIILLILFLWWMFRKDQGKVELPHEDHAHGETPAVSTKVESVPVPVEEPVKEHIEVPARPDDLKIIEGIGPKIEKLLNDAGITTFAGLAATEVSHLEQILAEAKLRIADPTTWPEQALLAAQGKMTELQALQDSLKGGRKG